jgi:hypothetical protein
MENVRKHERYYLSSYLKVIDRQTSLTIGHCVNISEGGMMLISEEPVKLKKIYQLKMLLPAVTKENRNFEFVALSKWSMRDENPDFYNTGFQLHDVTPEIIRIIETLIDKFCMDD